MNRSTCYCRSPQLDTYGTYSVTYDLKPSSAFQQQRHVAAMGHSADQKNLSMFSRIPAAWTAPRDTRSMLTLLLLHSYYLLPSLISLLFVPAGFSAGMANSVKHILFVIIPQYSLSLAWVGILMKERNF
jgi:hypothetical protein